MKPDTELSSTPPSHSASAPRSTRNWGWIGRALLFLLGAAALFGMVHQVGPAQILATIERTARWLPLICCLDFFWVALEGGALLILYGSYARRIRPSYWVYVTLVHYSTFMLLPMGRTSAEVARAALLKRVIDRDLAAVGAAIMQSFTMVGTAVISAVAGSFLIPLSHSRTLLVAVGGNAALMLLIGSSSYLVLRRFKLGNFLGKRFSKLASAGPGFDQQFAATTGRHFSSFLFCLLGRCVQTAQYGVIILAVTGSFSFALAWIAEGIQMMARSAGDFIPNQVGVTEGAFMLFSKALNLGETPALAMTIALVARISNMTVASLCIAVSQLWPKSGSGFGEPTTVA